MEGRLVASNIADGSHQLSEPLKISASGGGFGCTPAPTTVAIYGPPAVSGDSVYIGGYNGKVYVFNSSSLKMNDDYPPEGNLEPIVGGLVVALDQVYFGSSDGKVYALSIDPLEKKWDFQTGDKIWSTPVIDGDTLYIGSFDKKLYALSAADGMEKWEFETGGAIASTPLVYNNTVYVGSFDRYLYAVDAINGKQVWRFPAEDEADNRPENWFWTKPVAYNNTIYAGNLDGKLYILNAETGDEIVAAVDLESPISSWPVSVDDSIIVASEEGVLYAIDTDSNQKSELGNLEEEVFAALSASEEIVYIHTEKDALYAVDTQTGALRELYIE
jgi:outer membrane protein assembly factor BamB